MRASYAVKDVVAKYGGRALMNRVGHAFIKRRMREENAIFGGEVTGHYYFRDNFYADNGFIPAVLMLELMSRKKQTLEQLLDLGLGLAGGEAEGGRAVDVGRGVAVVARHPRRAEGRVDLHQRAQRHHLAGGVARLELRDRGRVGAERRVGLHDDLVGLAELGEVVDVERAEVDLHRVVDVAQVHAHLLGTRAVHVGVELRQQRQDLPDGQGVVVGDRELDLVALGPVVLLPALLLRGQPLARRRERDVAHAFEALHLEPRLQLPQHVRKTVIANTMADLPPRCPRGALPAHGLLTPGAHNLEIRLRTDNPPRLADQLPRMGDERP